MDQSPEAAGADSVGIAEAAAAAKAALSRAMGKKVVFPVKEKRPATVLAEPVVVPPPVAPEPEVSPVEPPAEPASPKVKAKSKPKRVTKSEKKPKGRKKLGTPHTFGQRGVEIENFKTEKLNDKERAVLGAYNTIGPRELRGIPELAATCFPKFSVAKATSWVRNSLRRLIRAKLLEKESRGLFRLSASGRKFLVQSK